MAGHVDASDAELINELPAKPERRSRNLAVSVAALLVVVLGGLTGWLGHQQYRAHREQVANDQFLAVGRQAATNLTSIDYSHVEADVARILDSATGTFLQDFQQRAQPFAEVVKQVKSKSEGTVTEAALESVHADEAQVVIALQVRTSVKGEPESEPRGWRMRINVQKAADGFKVSNVQFVQ